MLNMTEMITKYIFNLVWCGILLCIIFYSIVYVFILREKKKSRVMNILLFIIIFLFSIFIAGFAPYRTYKYYKIDGKVVSMYYFLVNAIKDLNEEEVMVIYSSSVEKEAYLKDYDGNRGNRKKVYIDYINIDNGKYVIPVDSNFQFNNLGFNGEYVVYVYKNTKFIKDIIKVQNN